MIYEVRKYKVYQGLDRMIIKGIGTMNKIVKMASQEILKSTIIIPLYITGGYLISHIIIGII